MRPSQIKNYIWAIHTILYRVCCIEYTLLFVNAQFYAILCISYSKCIFWHLNNLIGRNQHCFWKTYENICTFFSFTQFDSMKSIQLLWKKNVYKCIEFNDLTTGVNWAIITGLVSNFFNALCKKEGDIFFAEKKTP